MRVALHFAVIAAFALMLGLLRWPSVHWELGRMYMGADGSQREIIAALFAGFNTYLGNYIGEFLGEGLMHAFLLIAAVAMLKSPAFPKWMARVGITVSILDLAGIFRNVSGFAAAVQDVVNTGMIFPIWLVLMGVGLVRASRGPASGDPDHSVGPRVSGVTDLRQPEGLT